MKHVLVTGATGFVGRPLTRRLLDEGLRVRVLVRDPSRLPTAHRRRVEVIVGAMGDPTAAAAAVKGVDTVLHLAGLATAFERRPERYFETNVDGLRVLHDAAGQAGVQRLVHVSTVAVTAARGRKRVPGLSRRPTDYALSKAASEELIRRRRHRSPETVVVRPTRVYGPGPWNDANGTTRLISMYLRGTFRFVLADGGVRGNYVHVGDVVDGIVRGARRGRPGHSYMLGGTDATLRGFLAMIARLSGVRRRTFAVPPLLMVPAAQVLEGWGRLGGRTSLTPAWLNYFLEDRPADIAASRRDLGYAPRDLELGLGQTLAWLTDFHGKDDHGTPRHSVGPGGGFCVRPAHLWS